MVALDGLVVVVVDDYDDDDDDVGSDDLIDLVMMIDVIMDFGLYVDDYVNFEYDVETMVVEAVEEEVISLP